MSTRRINLDFPDVLEPQRNAWLEANGLDPSDVPAEQEVLVTSEAIVFMEFMPRVDGQRTLTRNGRSYRKRAASVSLISAPENFGL